MAEHVRIDEGTQRNQPAAPWPARRPSIPNKLGANFDPTPILDRYLHGEEIADIADTLGVHPKALNYHLLKPDIVEAWRAAQVAVSLAELQEAKSVIRSSPDSLSLGRAREQLRSAQWDLERLLSRLFGQSQVAVQVNANGPIQVNVVSFAATAQTPVIEGTCVEQDVMSKACPPSILPPSDPE